MKIAINAEPLTSGHRVRGVGFYTKNLIKSLGGKVEAVNFDSTDLDKFDIVHLPFFDPFFINLPLKALTRTIVTIHDVIPLIYPEHYPPGLKGSIRLLVNKLLLKKVKAVITDTECSKKDIVRLLGLPVDKIYVTHLAPAGQPSEIDSKDMVKVKNKYNLPKKFVLYVGDVNFNKNISSLIKACKIINIPLVIVGKQAAEIEVGYDLVSLRGPKDWLRFVFGISHPQTAHLKGMIHEFKDKNVIRLGFLTDHDRDVVYSLASVYCQPSFYEGFGLPLLEAMAHKTPVVASKTQALVEIGESACLFFDPNDPKDIADKLKQVISDKNLRAKLVNAGTNLVKKYSWEKTAKDTLAVYAKI